MSQQTVARWTVALALLASGCGPAVSFTTRGNACPAAPPDCAIEVITSRPARDYQLVGVLDIEAFAVRSIPVDEEAFRGLVGPEVCAAGGDAVIPGITGDGRYIQATVVKWIDPDAPGPVCPPPAEEVPSDDPSDEPESEEGSPPAEGQPGDTPEPPNAMPTAPEGATSASDCCGGAPC